MASKPVMRWRVSISLFRSTTYAQIDCKNKQRFARKYAPLKSKTCALFWGGIKRVILLFTRQPSHYGFISSSSHSSPFRFHLLEHDSEPQFVFVWLCRASIVNGGTAGGATG
tara:strand:- start:18 stop:353 length:336 start_codon:yes stop_codon:yes gene_type:complete